MHERGQVVTSLLLGSVLVLSVWQASPALAVGGTSSTLQDSVSSMPCDGVTYPVADSGLRSYEEAAGTPLHVANKTTQTLTVTNAKTVTETVTTSGVGGHIDVNFGTKNFTLGSVGVEYVPPTHTNGTTVTFTTSSSIKISAIKSDIYATPTFFRQSGAGSYYKCNPGENPVMSGHPGDLQIDIVGGMGWVVTCSANPCVAGHDYKMT